MHYGVFIFPTDYSIRIENWPRRGGARLRVLVRDEHTPHSTSRRHRFAGGGPLPKEYAHTLDPSSGSPPAAAVTATAQAGQLASVSSWSTTPSCSPRRSRSSRSALERAFSSGSGRAGTLKKWNTNGTVFKTPPSPPRADPRDAGDLDYKEAASFHGES